VHDLANPAAGTADENTAFRITAGRVKNRTGMTWQIPRPKLPRPGLVDHGFPDRSRPGENREGIAGCSEFFTIIMAENQHDTQ
jgi:hypothetical protein